jgi:aldehyde:ferredoxin oxidoreductase
MLKYAGYDAVAIMGAAAKPTWIDIRDGVATLKDATNMWGLDTFEAQAIINKSVLGTNAFWDWNKTAANKPTTQRPAILVIGPVGEAQSRIGAIVSETGDGAGQGGFGGIWGSKNLKAISALGTGSIQVADPAGLLATRLWVQNTYSANVDNPALNATQGWQKGVVSSHFGGSLPGAVSFDPEIGPNGCYGCPLDCRPRTTSGLGNGQTCNAAGYYGSFDKALHGKATEITGSAADLANKMGINMFGLADTMINYLVALNKAGVIGQGSAYSFQTNLPFNKVGDMQFVRDLFYKIAYKEDIGADLNQGVPRASAKWGRLKQDLASGLLNMPYWGYRQHYEPRTEVYWGYASIMSDRDICCHDFNTPVMQMPGTMNPPVVPAQWLADVFTALPPYYDSEMMNFSPDNIYTLHMARSVAWILHYTRFWKQSLGLCDEAYADFLNVNAPNNRGLTPTAEPRFFQNVTGTALSFEDSMELGRKIYNLDKSIWVLQGRHRDMEVMADYVYSVPASGASMNTRPVRNGTTWSYKDLSGQFLDKTQFENWKTLFLQLEGWDTKTGWPTRATLEGLGLKNVADTLQTNGKLGSST